MTTTGLLAMVPGVGTAMLVRQAVRGGRRSRRSPVADWRRVLGGRQGTLLTLAAI